MCDVFWFALIASLSESCFIILIIFIFSLRFRFTFWLLLSTLGTRYFFVGLFICWCFRCFFLIFAAGEHNFHDSRVRSDDITSSWMALNLMLLHLISRESVLWKTKHESRARAHAHDRNALTTIILSATKHNSSCYHFSHSYVGFSVYERWLIGAGIHFHFHLPLVNRAEWGKMKQKKKLCKRQRTIEYVVGWRRERNRTQEMSDSTSEWQIV